MVGDGGGGSGGRVWGEEVGVQSPRVLIQSAAGRGALVGGGRRGHEVATLLRWHVVRCFEKSLLSFSFLSAVVCQSRQFKSRVWLKILVVFGFCDDDGCQ